MCYYIDECRIVDVGELRLNPETFCLCKRIMLEVVVEWPGQPPSRLQPHEYEEFFRESVKDVIGTKINDLIVLE